MVFYAACNMFVRSQQQLTLCTSFLGFISTRLWLSNIFPQDSLWFQRGWNPIYPGHRSYNLPLSQAGAIGKYEELAPPLKNNKKAEV